MSNKVVNIEELSRLAFYKWQLNGKKSMNTFLFSLLKKYELTDKQFQLLIDMSQKRIRDFEIEREKEETDSIEQELNDIIIYGDVY